MFESNLITVRLLMNDDKPTINTDDKPTINVEEIITRCVIILECQIEFLHLSKFMMVDILSKSAKLD